MLTSKAVTEERAPQEGTLSHLVNTASVHEGWKTFAYIFVLHSCMFGSRKRMSHDLCNCPAHVSVVTAFASCRICLMTCLKLGETLALLQAMNDPPQNHWPAVLDRRCMGCNMIFCLLEDIFHVCFDTSDRAVFLGCSDH